MTVRANIKSSARAVTVHVPLAFKRRGGRKLVLAPDGSRITNTARPRVDNAMVKAIARAYRWQSLLEDGTYATIEETAASEKISATYVGRLLRLTLLAPDIVEMILEGRQPERLSVDDLLRPISKLWREQRLLLT